MPLQAFAQRVVETPAFQRFITGVILLAAVLVGLETDKGIAAVFLFGENDPVHFGTLPLAVLTLFIVVTGENWSATLYTQMYGCEQFGYEGVEALCTASSGQPILAPLFFVSFIVLGTMVILNLVIGVAMNSMQEAQVENERMDEAVRGGDATHPSLEHELFELRQALTATLHRLDQLTQRAQGQGR